MTDNSQQTLIQELLRQASAGDAAALVALLLHCGARLTSLTQRMLGS